jgi:hypothetical protein
MINHPNFGLIPTLSLTAVQAHSPVMPMFAGVDPSLCSVVFSGRDHGGGGGGGSVVQNRVKHELMGSLVAQGPNPTVRFYLPFTKEFYLFGQDDIQVGENEKGLVVSIQLKRENGSDWAWAPPKLTISHQTPDTTLGKIWDRSGLGYFMTDSDRRNFAQILRLLGGRAEIVRACELLAKKNDYISTPEPDPAMERRFGWIYGTAVSAYVLSYACDKAAQTQPGPKDVYFTGTEPGRLDRVIVTSPRRVTSVFARRERVLLKREDYPGFFAAMEGVGILLDTEQTRFGLVWQCSSDSYLNFPADIKGLAGFQGPSPVRPPLVLRDLFSSDKNSRPSFQEDGIARAARELQLYAAHRFQQIGLLEGGFIRIDFGDLRIDEALFDLREIYEKVFPLKVGTEWLKTKD